MLNPMRLNQLSSQFNAKRKRLDLLDQQRAKLQTELLELHRKIQAELDSSVAGLAENGSRPTQNNGSRRSRPRISQKIVHDALSRAGKAVTRKEIVGALLAVNSSYKMDYLDSILEMAHGPAIRAGSKWKANPKWVSKRGRPRKAS